MKKETVRKPLKICHFIHTLQIGGAEMLLLKICDELNRRYPGQYEFVILTTDRSGPLQQKFEEAGLRVVSVNLEKRRFLSCVAKVMMLLLKLRPAIVHTHLLPPDKYGQTAAFFARIRHRVSTIHNMEPHLTGAERFAVELVRLFATNMIAVSTGVKDNVVSRYRYRASKIEVIHTAPSAPAAVDRAKELTWPVRIVNIANVKESKGHQFVVPAAIAMRDIDARFSWEIIGSTDSPLADVMRTSIAGNNLAESVILRGKVANASQLLPQYSIMISLSVYEGLPLSVIEGMSAGLPLILSDIPPHRELLEGIDGALFVRPDAPAEVAEAYRKLTADPGNYSRLSGQMIERAKEFSIPKMVERYHRFYQAMR
jgi:glycosyltransferase involved in cell wall biosynthesis